MVALPETALSDIEYMVESGYDAMIVDKCHYIIGKDAYTRFMKKIKT